MTTNRFRAIVPAALLALGACVAPASAQRLGMVQGRGPLNSVPAIRMDRQPGWVRFPEIRMGGWGVRSEAPRGIGKVHGSLLTPPPDDRPDVGPINTGQFFPTGGNGGFVRSPDGRIVPGPMVPGDGAAFRVGPGGVDAAVVASGDRWAIAAALRNSIDYSWLNHRWHNWISNDCIGRYGYGGFYGSYDTYYPASFGIDPYYAGAFVMHGNPPPPPAPVQPPVDPEANLSIPERAALRLQEGRPDAAIVMLRSYADTHPYDHQAARALAVALLDARRTKEGIAVMALVYEQDPTLALSPLAPDIVGPERELRDLVIRVVEFGHRTNESAAWLTAAVLMQGEGREDTAFKMIERADGFGLDGEVSKAMRSALKP